MLTPNAERNNTAILVIGAAGFIRSNMMMELLKTKESVTIVGLDSVNDYYEVSMTSRPTISWYLCRQAIPR